jgi:hypothetical protein
MVPGVVHDVSSSGETAFMEPLEIIPFVNELENLSAEEKAEEIRILRQLSAWIREDADRIAACFITLVELDRLDCVARFAEQFNMAVPELNQEGRCGCCLPVTRSAGNAGRQQGHHPDCAAGSGAGNTTQVLVISGPNAGGKTIALENRRPDYRHGPVRHAGAGLPLFIHSRCWMPCWWISAMNSPLNRVSPPFLPISAAISRHSGTGWSPQSGTAG